MFGSSQNQRDIPESSLKDTSNFNEKGQASSPLSVYTKTAKYRKTNKLITALYMVTDTMENDEPVRAKLRTLGVDILSDVSTELNLSGGTLRNKIETTMSFLSIAADMNMISEMNANILLQEFGELRKAIIELNEGQNGWLGEFMKKPLLEELPARGYLSNMSLTTNKGFYKGHVSYNGQQDIKDTYRDKGQNNSIGVQKGSTLLNALQSLDKKDTKAGHSKRQQEVLDIIKDNQKDNEGLTITDIKAKAKGELAKLGNKTLQRELVSMVETGILRKEGSKRWSKYLVNRG